MAGNSQLMHSQDLLAIHLRLSTRRYVRLRISIGSSRKQIAGGGGQYSVAGTHQMRRKIGEETYLLEGTHRLVGIYFLEGVTIVAILHHLLACVRESSCYLFIVVRRERSSSSRLSSTDVDAGTFK